MCSSDLRFAADNFALLWRSLADTIEGGNISDADRQAFTAAWSQPGALTGMFNWYRAMRLEPPPAATTIQDSPGGTALYADDGLMVRVPTLVLWGLKDKALLPGCIEGLERWVPGVEIVKVEDATHWILYEKQDLITTRLRAWLEAR